MVRNKYILCTRFKGHNNGRVVFNYRYYYMKYLYYSIMPTSLQRMIHCATDKSIVTGRSIGSIAGRHQ